LAKRGKGRFYGESMYLKIPLHPPFPKGESLVFSCSFVSQYLISIPAPVFTRVNAGESPVETGQAGMTEMWNYSSDGIV